MGVTASDRWRWLRMSLLALALLVSAWLTWWILWPDFIELDVSVPLHRSGAADIWGEESRSQVRYTYPTSAGCDYVLRRLGSVAPHRHPWQSQEEIIEHFDQWLTARGWVVRDINPGLNPALPEADFLGKKHAGVRYYTRSADRWAKDGFVVVAVWPGPYGDPPTWYNVVLASVRPSFVRRLARSFDD